jgi:hypothetical protein
MKKIIFICLLAILGCEKEEASPSLNGIFEGTISGWAQPINFSGQTVWAVTHQGNEVTANIKNQNIQGISDTFTFKGNITNDSTIVGTFTETANGFKVNGKYSKDMKHLWFESGDNGVASSYFRFKCELTKKE